MDAQSYESLTRMERNCLRLARYDHKTEQIAHELGISASTVNTHIFSARRKLGGVSRLAAADMVRDYELRRTDDGPVPPAGRGQTAVATLPDAPTSFPPTDPDGSSQHSREQPPSQPEDPSARSIATDHRLSRHPMWMAAEAASNPKAPHPTDVREVRTAFVFDDDRPDARGRQVDDGDAPLRRLALILAIAVLMALVAIAAPAIYDSAAMRIANSLERPHPR